MSSTNVSNIRVVLLSGEEFQRLERLSELISSSVDESTRDFNLDVLRPEDFLLGTLSERIMTFPMMAERRVVVVRDFDKIHKETAIKTAVILAKTPETTLVLVEGETVRLTGLPKNHTRTETFKPIYENKLPVWIRERFRKRGKKVDDKAVALIINNIGIGLREIDNEIEKTVIIAGGGDLVTEEHVKRVVGEFKRDSVWELCNAVGLGDFKGSVKILKNLMETEKNKETTYISKLFSHIMKLSEYNRLRKSGLPHAEAMKAVTSSPFLWDLNRLDEQTRNFNPQAAARSLTVLGRTESQLKRSRLDKELLLELALPFLVPK